MKWLLTGDWQTRFSNLHECEIAHKQELNIIKKYKIGGHIDLGDLKDQYSPVDVETVQFQFERTKNILEPVDHSFKLLGNHDRIGQHSDDRNWLSLFNVFTHIGGRVITEPDIIYTKTLAVFGLPYTRDPKKFLEGADYLAAKARKYKATPKILIFHQEVQGAKFSKLRGKPSTSIITLEGLHAGLYDQIFGGHVHLRQRLAKYAQFIGNPFATDWGEIDQRKGFTIYDDKTNETTFVESEVPGRFSYVYLTQKHIKKVADGTQIKDTVLCPSVKLNYHKLISKKISEISAAYPNALIQVVPKFETTDGIEEETSSNSSEAEKLRLYIKASIPHRLKKHRKRVIAYLQTIMERSLGKRIRSSDKITFEKMEASNVLSFNRVKFDYRKRGTICVTGRNKSGNILSSNGAGKTNFLSLPCVALEGRTFKGQQYDRWANWRIKDPAVISQSIRTSKGDKIDIVRGRRPASLQLLINGEDASAGMKTADVQKQIEEVTGFTYDTLANSVYIDQTLSNAFILGTDKSRSELIARFQNLDKYEDARKLAAFDMKKLTTIESETEYEIGVLQEHLEERKKELKHQRRSVDEKKESVRKELTETKDLQKIEEKRAAQWAKIRGKKKHALEKKHESVLEEEKKIDSQIYMLSKISDSYEKTISRLKKYSTLEKCPECLRPITKDARAHMLSEAKKIRDKRSKKIKEFSQQQKTLKKKLSKYEKKITALSEQIDLGKELVSGGRKWIHELESKLHAIEDIQRENEEMSGASAAIRDAEVKIAASKKYLHDISRQQAIVSFAVETFSRKGFPAFLSKLVCPVLNKASEYYSDLFLDGEIAVVFEVVNDTLTPRIVNPNGDKEIEGQSTGEKAWAGLIASFALREIAQRSNLLILDEPGHGLDSAGAKRFGEKIKKLEDRFETILVCTHNENIMAALEGVSQIEVTKTNKISRLSGVLS